MGPVPVIVHPTNENPVFSFPVLFCAVSEPCPGCAMEFNWQLCNVKQATSRFPMASAGHHDSASRIVVIS